MEEIAKAMRLKAELDAMRPINAEQEARIMQKFRLDWNYHSNHLEGNSLTFGETKTLLLYGITAQGKPLKDHIEMTGHNEALNWVLDIVKGERMLTETFVRELHELLLKEPYEVDAITPDGKPTKRVISVGKYKSVPNHVRTQTGEIHYFAKPEETPAKMEELVHWYREQLEREDANPIFVAALFHHRFINIHPFDDGNGRTGRLLMNFILMKYGFPPAIIKTEDKLNYYRALQQADGGAVDVFVEYIAKNLVRSLEIMLAGARGENIEEPDDLDKELALLEQRLKGMGKKAEVLKSKEAILEVFEQFVEPLISALEKSAPRFDKFYAERSISWGGFNPRNPESDLFFPEPEYFSKNKFKIDGSTETLSVLVSFRGFLYAELSNLEFSEVVNIAFDTHSYSVVDSAGIALVSAKYYHESISEAEILKVANEIDKKHAAFLDEKLRELEEGKSKP
jgi:Fic family protein